jgi:hypothetical protein
MCDRVDVDGDHVSVYEKEIGSDYHLIAYYNHVIRVKEMDNE